VILNFFHIGFSICFAHFFNRLLSAVAMHEAIMLHVLFPFKPKVVKGLWGVISKLFKHHALLAEDKATCTFEREDYFVI
jgi:hypothetical protein